MNCMKCGRETLAEQVFCQECCLEMEKYPVKPGTVVLLPKRKDNSAPKKVSRRKVLSLEDQVRTLRRWVRGLVIALILSLVLCGILADPAIRHMTEDHFAIGQNYNSVTPTTIPSVPAETMKD